MNLPDLLPHFENWTRSGQGRYMASCPMPGHNDSDPSVSITQDSETGKILLYCWGCDTKGFELIQALGLRPSDLFGDPGHPSAVRQASQEPMSPVDQAALSDYVTRAQNQLDLAEDYINQRFGIDLAVGLDLKLGADSGASGFERPLSCAAFNSGTPHLIIPFLDPTGQVVGMQGRRLVDGEPRWRSASGAGWSKMGCFGWDSLGQDPMTPIIITEGPSDALAVVGLAGLPALAIRGASNTSDAVCSQIIEWLGDRPAIVIGDNGEAGIKFSEGISQGVGIPAHQLPEQYSDLSEFLSAGGSLEAVIQIASSSEAEMPDLRSAEEVDSDLTIRILANFERAIYDEDLKKALREIPQWRQEGILLTVTERAPGARGHVRPTVANLRRALRDGGPGGDGGGDNGNHGPAVNRNPNNLPEILWNPEDQLYVTEERIKDAMDQYDGGDFYQAAAGQYVTVVDKDLVNLKDAGVKMMLSKMGHWRVVNGARETGHVPHDASKMVCDPSWVCDIPTIKRRVEVPFMLADGQIVSEAGFHYESGIYLLPRDPIIVPEVPAIVTDEHVNQARQIFEDVVEGFIFKDHGSKANLIAMTLTSPLRELFKDSPMVPLLTSTAPQSGSGKGTSVRVPLSTAGVGPYSLSTTAYNPDENEFEKKLVGKLLKKSTYIFLDNIRAQVSSSVLEQMLTAANYDGRTLGFSEVNSLSTLVLWVCTLQSTGGFNRDLTRRCVPVELIKNYNGTWAHKNIDAYLADMRGQLIWACFVVARKWLQDGAPISEARLDGYGGWTEVIGGILENVLGYEGFLTNLDSFRNQQDEVSMTIDGILERWLTLYGEEPHPARMAVEDYEDPALHQLLGLHNPTPRQVMNALERQLQSQRGHVVGNSHIWEPVGTKNYGHEGPKKLFRCVPIHGSEV